MRRRVTQDMLNNQFAIWCKDHSPHNDEHHFFLEKHAPGDGVYWRLCYGRKDGKGGVTDSLVTHQGYSAREMFDVLYFANQCAAIPQRLANGIYAS